MKGMRGVVSLHSLCVASAQLTSGFSQMFGGASLNDEVGNALAVQGVSLYTIYGTSEVGSINGFARREWA